MTEIHEGAVLKPCEGLVITFYSYNGGTGRTMTLANVAWILAANGHRVLVADWDLESPGLHRFFHPFLAESLVRDGSGVIDLIRDYHRAAARASQQERTQKLVPSYARVEPYAVTLNWKFAAGGGIDYVSPGRQNTDYAATLGALDWDNFYESLSGGEFFDALRSDMKRHYDYVLIDSRTGLSDIADICTVHFPDVLVDCFTLSTQGIEGAAQVAKMIGRRQDRDIRILPVPMRVDDGAQKKAAVGRKLAMRAFDGIPAGMSEAERRGYWTAVEVPYKPFYAFEEILAAFGERAGAPGSLLSSYEHIAASITDGAVTGLPLMDEQVRDRVLKLFTRQPPREIAISVELVAEDQMWAEWISGILHGAGIKVRERHLTETSHREDHDAATRTLTIISGSFRDRQRPQLTKPSRSDLTLYVTPGRPLPEFSSAQAAFVAGIPEKEAVERLLRLLDIVDYPGSDLEGLAYYPGREPKIDRTPARNSRFTGREADLRGLREQLREHGRAVVLPVALHGLGGVGKTQIALEYVHRFKSDYDLVWWLDCSQPQFIDAALVDLAASIQDVLGVPIPVTADLSEQAGWVVRQLAEGQAVPRWLLVYDNAEDMDAVRRLLPEGGGHVLITSRNRAWSEQARTLPIEVFTRAESVAHLHARVPSITGREAEQVAETLGDLPLAVALAGAWLSETGYSVSGYLSELQRHAPEALSVSQLADYPQPLSRAWDLSFNWLRERSEAAMRLFELCAVMEARIALDLLYSPAMARVLVPFDPALSERMMIGRVVQEINRLALIKLDSSAQRVHVHRLVQAIVQGRMSAGQLAAARHDVQQVLAAARPRRDVDDPETWPRYRLIWPHLEPSQAMTSDDEPVRQLFVDRVRYLYIRHDLERGRELALQTEQAWERMLAAGPEQAMETALRRQLLHLRFNLGNILRDLARYEEARALDETVLDEQRELLGLEHPHTLMTAGSLAADLRALGQYQDALRLDMETYPAWTELFGEDYAPTLSAANNLADSYRMTADFSAALRVDEETLERRRTSLGPLHPRTLGSSCSVARDLVELGRYAEAVDLMETVRQAYAEVSNEAVAEWNAQVLLGIAMRACGRPHDAAAYFLNALDGLSRRFGESSPEALACRLSCAGNLLTLRQAEGAEREIHEVLARYGQGLGPSHPHTLVAWLNLADALRQIHEPDAALDAARTAAAGLTATLGDNHPYALAAQVSVGVLLAERGELAAAEELEAKTVAGLVEALGNSHPDALRGRANLLLTRADLGNKAAEAERGEVIQRLASVLGPNHPHIGRLVEEHRLMRTLDPQPF